CVIRVFPNASQARATARQSLGKASEVEVSDLWLYCSAAMAVPKRRQTSARRDKRRATHRLEAPRVNECPVCHRPKLPPRMGPTCKTYGGREGEPLGTPAP